MVIDYLIAQKVQKLYDSGKDYPKYYANFIVKSNGECESVLWFSNNELGFLSFDDNVDLDESFLKFDDIQLLHFLDSKELYVSVYPILDDETLEYCNWCYDITNITGFQLSSSIAMTRDLATKEGILQALTLLDDVHS